MEVNDQKKTKNAKLSGAVSLTFYHILGPYPTLGSQGGFPETIKATQSVTQEKNNKTLWRHRKLSKDIGNFKSSLVISAINTECGK